jgi:predicted Zn-dependent protease
MSISASCTAQEGRIDDALACFRRALALDPRRRHRRHHLAATLLSLGRYPEAIAQLREAVRRNESNGWAWGTWRMLCSRPGSWRGGFSGTRARALDPASAGPYSVLALVHTVRGEVGQAVSVLQEGHARTGAGGCWACSRINCGGLRLAVVAGGMAGNRTPPG